MKIVVVGGGTAGWLAALMITRIRPEHTVTVIESSKIGIIGAGEGSTGSLTNVIQNIMWDFGINEQEFITTCTQLYMQYRIYVDLHRFLYEVCVVTFVVVFLFCISL